MAPEQLAGSPASVKSDIYALGLILFEIFTGKRAHDAKTLNELRALHDTSFAFASDYLQWVESSSQSPNRWDELSSARPGAIFYWYRTSPRELVPVRSGSPVTITDPPELVTDMRTVALDTRGRLREFRAVPPQLDTDAPSAGAPDWKPFFDAAGLDVAAFTSVASTWTPPHFADARLAWEGAYPERRDIRIRVEAASYRGRPVSFSIIGPWTRPTRMTVAPITSLQRVLRAGSLVVWLGALVAAAFLARRHVRSGRADRRTVNTEVNQFFGGLGIALYLGGTLWVLYLALEPYARRLWPDGLLGWTRLFAGHVRDPRVGRDVLLGCLFGIVNSLIEAARLRLLPLTGRPMPDPTLGQDLSLLRGPEYIVRQLAGWFYRSLETAFFVALLFCGLRFVLRRDWLAGLAVILVVMAVGDNGQAILASRSLRITRVGPLRQPCGP
jgi:hypothetical protein